jgi:nucleosome binding factor SPN SPT16 subunit
VAESQKDHCDASIGRPASKDPSYQKEAKAHSSGRRTKKGPDEDTDKETPERIDHQNGLTESLRRRRIERFSALAGKGADGSSTKHPEEVEGIQPNGWSGRLIVWVERL